jgi:MoxR-like ATPase
MQGHKIACFSHVAAAQVAAYCNGRDTVTEYDCLLLQHVLWQRPDQADRIADWVLGQLSVDDGLKQVQYLMSGLYSRACRTLGRPDKVRDPAFNVLQQHGV